MLPGAEGESRFRLLPRYIAVENGFPLRRLDQYGFAESDSSHYLVQCFVLFCGLMFRFSQVARLRPGRPFCMRYIGGAGEKAFPAGAVCSGLNFDVLSSNIRTQVEPEAQSVMSDYNQSRSRTASAGAGSD